MVTAINNKELRYVPPQKDVEEVEALCIHTFEQPTTGTLEVEPDIFLLLTGNLYTTHASFAYRLDLADCESGSPVVPNFYVDFRRPRVVSTAAV